MPGGSSSAAPGGPTPAVPPCAPQAGPAASSEPGTSELRAWHQHGIPRSGNPAWAHPTSHIPAPGAPFTWPCSPPCPEGPCCPPGLCVSTPGRARPQPCPFQRCHHQVQSAKVLLFLHPLKTLKTEQNKQKKDFHHHLQNTLIHSPKSQRTPGHLLVGRVPLRPTRTLAGEATSDPAQILP